MGSAQDLAETMPAEEAGRKSAADVAAASVIALRSDAVLMVRRANPPFKDLWSFPGGRSEPHEDAEETARRELNEETGLTVGSMIRLGSFRPAADRPELILTVFAARAGHGAARAGGDAAEAAFVPLSRIVALRTTAGAPGWIARALLALGELGPPSR